MERAITVPTMAMMIQHFLMTKVNLCRSHLIGKSLKKQNCTSPTGADSSTGKKRNPYSNRIILDNMHHSQEVFRCFEGA